MKASRIEANLSISISFRGLRTRRAGSLAISKRTARANLHFLQIVENTREKRFCLYTITPCVKAFGRLVSETFDNNSCAIRAWPFPDPAPRARTRRSPSKPLVLFRL